MFDSVEFEGVKASKSRRLKLPNPFEIEGIRVKVVGFHHFENFNPLEFEVFRIP